MRPKIILILPIFSALAQSPDSTPAAIPLTVTAGSPLRVYLTKRLPKRTGTPVEAKLVEPLFAFDREVVPAGSQVLGHVSRIESVSKLRRTLTILGGDFTPLHEADVQFDTLVLPDGRRMALRTQESTGLHTLVQLHPRKPPANTSPNGGVLGTGKRQAQAQIDAAKEKLHGLADMVRGPDKMERLQDFVFSKLPYHPQWVRKLTRFDAELIEPLQFGSEPLNVDDLRLAGSQPPPDSLAHVRLLNAMNSSDTRQGDSVVAVLTQPLFSPNHKLIFPEGARLTGSVTAVRPARWFHRGGHLRFNFQNVELPPLLARLTTERPVTRTHAAVASVESEATGKVKVDREGGVTATESKTRFIAPAISLLISHRAADNDRGHADGGDSNVGGRTLGGASGFGMLGAVAAQASRTVGAVFGFWGLAVSVYNNIVSKGSEADFAKNSAMDVRFGARPPVPGSRFVGE